MSGECGFYNLYIKHLNFTRSAKSKQKKKKRKKEKKKKKKKNLVPTVNPSKHLETPTQLEEEAENEPG